MQDDTIHSCPVMHLNNHYQGHVQVIMSLYFQGFTSYSSIISFLLSQLWRMDWQELISAAATVLEAKDASEVQ